MALKHVDVEAYRYFSASVIWRAAVGKWREDRKVTLDPGHAESMRKYLLGEEGFPSFARILVFAADDARPIQMCAFPKSDPRDTYEEHVFIIPGIEFRFLTGNEMSGEAGIVFSKLSSDMVFLLHEQGPTSRTQDLCDMIRDSPPMGKLKKHRSPVP